MRGRSSQSRAPASSQKKEEREVKIGDTSESGLSDGRKNLNEVLQRLKGGWRRECQGRKRRLNSRLWTRGWRERWRGASASKVCEREKEKTFDKKGTSTTAYHREGEESENRIPSGKKT